MGIHDRDYYRDRAPQRSGDQVQRASFLRRLSVTNWLIIICVAVYSIDYMLPIVDVPTGNHKWYVPGAAQLDRDRIEMGPHYSQEGPNSLWRSVHERGSGVMVGSAQVMQMHWLTAHLHFSTRLGGLEFWRFIGYQFLHGSPAHLIFNMIALFIIGPVVEEWLLGKRYLAFFLLCGCCGALMYLLLNGIGYFQFLRFGVTSVPGLLFSDPSTPLVGASGSILGIIVAGAYLAPRDEIMLLNLIPVQLRFIAWFLVVTAIVSLFTGGLNAGGEAAHLGGAIAGFYFIRRPHHLHNFFDVLGRVDPTSHHYREGGGRRGGAGSGGPPQRWRSRVRDPREMDRILDKISREGLQSLSDEEKRTLAQASQS